MTTTTANKTDSTVTIQRRHSVIECFFKRNMSKAEIAILTGKNTTEISAIIYQEMLSITEAKELAEIPVECWPKKSEKIMDLVINLCSSLTGEPQDKIKDPLSKSIGRILFFHLCEDADGLTHEREAQFMGMGTRFRVMTALNTASEFMLTDRNYVGLYERGKFLLWQKLNNMRNTDKAPVIK